MLSNATWLMRVSYSMDTGRREFPRVGTDYQPGLSITAPAFNVRSQRPRYFTCTAPVCIHTRVLVFMRDVRIGMAWVDIVMHM